MAGTGRHSRPELRPPERLEAPLPGRAPVVLRRWRAAHAESAYRVVMAAREHLRPWAVWAAGYDREAAAAFTAQCEQDWVEGTGFHYAILTDGAVVGGCGLLRLPGAADLEVGYWLHQAHIGRGLATAAVGALLHAGFELPGVDHVRLVHDAANLRSRAVAVRLGFTEVGRRTVTGERRILGDVEVLWRLDRPA